MSVFKCKMCGGSLEITTGLSVATCEYCGTQQTLPKLNNDKKANLYDRANHFRRANDYDKAMGIYEQILNEDNNDAEAYWSLVLCRYGIEYVEDPATKKRIPTVNRAQFTSIFADENYKSALQYADDKQKAIYEQEAKAIDNIQKGILEISNNEDPFDVFICYKESDGNGKRTQDSVLANDLYHQLTAEGFKVFYAAITLEDKLGSAYEPYIFAALNSAKVMVVLGTKPEYFNAVWVKNEWSRYLALIRGGAKKMLIPAYKGMDPYDLPEEFSHLQAQDMSKLGFMQDLIRGIKKILQSDEKKVVVEAVGANPQINVQTTNERALLLIEDGENEKANEYLEQALNIAPKEAMIYVGKLLLELGVKKQDDLSRVQNTFDNSANYEKIMRFADKELKEKIKGYNEAVKERNAKDLYAKCIQEMAKAKTEQEFLTIKQNFDSISFYSDSKEKAKICMEKSVIAKKEAAYNKAVTLMSSKSINKIADYNKAIELFKSVDGYKDSEAKISECDKLIDAEKEKQKAANAKTKKILKIAIPSAVAVAIVLILLFTLIIPTIKYNNALELIANEDYDEGYAILTELEDFKDSPEQIKLSKYERANALLSDKKYDEAYDLFTQVEGYSDADELAKECQYQKAVIYREDKDWDSANEIFETIKDYKDSEELIHYHDFEEVDSKEATCTKGGFVDYKCECGEEKHEDLSSLGHNYSAATCTKPKICERCDKKEGKPLGHDSEGTTCTKCGKITFKTLKFSGTGTQIIRDIDLPEGSYLIESSFVNYSEGVSNVAAWFYHDSREDLILNNYGDSGTDSTFFNGSTQDAYIQIETAMPDASWEITIEAK